MSARYTLRLFEVAWLLQETLNATRRLCRTGEFRVIQHGRCIEIPVEQVRARLRSTRALRCLDGLIVGAIEAPRGAKPSAPPAPLRVSLP